MELRQRRCEACRKDSHRLTESETATLLAQVEGWEVVTISDIPRLRKEFRFKNFGSALEFTNQVGRLAENEGHHPALLTEWGRVVVEWWTHKIRGLHENDFICAAKTDGIAAEGHPNP